MSTQTTVYDLLVMSTKTTTSLGHMILDSFPIKGRGVSFQAGTEGMPGIILLKLRNVAFARLVLLDTGDNQVNEGIW